MHAVTVYFDALRYPPPEMDYIAEVTAHVNASVMLPVALQAALARLMGSSALSLHREGRQREVTFVDASLFWNIRNGQVSSVEETADVIASIRKTVGEGSTVLADGMEVGGRALRKLAEVHETMENRFAAHLKLMKRRGVAPGSK